MLHFSILFNAMTKQPEIYSTAIFPLWWFFCKLWSCYWMECQANPKLFNFKNVGLCSTRIKERRFFCRPVLDFIALPLSKSGCGSSKNWPLAHGGLSVLWQTWILWKSTSDTWRVSISGRNYFYLCQSPSQRHCLCCQVAHGQPFFLKKPIRSQKIWI